MEMIYVNIKVLVFSIKHYEFLSSSCKSSRKIRVKFT